MISPFLTLDEERRKRDAALLEKLGSFGGSMVKAPLSFQTLYQEQEDRQRKIAADAEELSRKRAQETRDTETHEQGKETHKQRMEKGTFDLGKEKAEASEKKVSKNISDLVSGMLEQGASDQEIIERSFGHPELEEVTDQSAIEGEIGRQRAAMAEREGKLGLKSRELDIKQQMADARAKDADTRREAAKARIAASRAARPKPQRLLGEAATKRLEDLDIRLDDLARIKDYKTAVDTGLGEGMLLTLKRYVHMDSPKEALFNTENQRYINEELHRLGGATLTDSEYRRISKAMPKVFDEADVFEALVDASERKLMQDYNTIVNTQKMAGRNTEGFAPKQTAVEKTQDKSAQAADILKALLGE